MKNITTITITMFLANKVELLGGGGWIGGEKDFCLIMGLAKRILADRNATKSFKLFQDFIKNT
ncbi:hypothetical protein Hanom_Chr12g01112371 [Helianthus anomalus]